MLIHPWDSVDDWHRLVPGNDFGQLVTAGHVDGWPVIVPTHFIVEGDEVLLHLARPNPVWRALESDDRVVLSLIGDWTYVDAAMNSDPGDDPALGVPTSYYSALQLHGHATVIDDPEAKADILARQLAHFEPPGSTRVTPSPAIESDRRQLPGIRGLRIRIDHVRAKQKYGGNKPAAQRQGIADALAQRDGPGDRAAVAHLRAGSTSEEGAGTDE
ncbi:FMN-binding negative transcriptional regulator [Nocardioides sp. Root140]|uniref:FMN-binding negative transcriptional regulator n=1 Tax=Nocardioides sp. Root140 TaxID=1736460 RepID=UPI0006FF8F5E|nr:FMN-binding negative transcriptional regulator [Nocardioides sp. Root140]KQY54196.1 hypothetical protein ASD30_18425 [Nocardioides sp. Root140]